MRLDHRARPVAAAPTPSVATPPQPTYAPIRSGSGLDHENDAMGPVADQNAEPTCRKKATSSECLRALPSKPPPVLRSIRAGTLRHRSVTDVSYRREARCRRVRAEINTLFTPAVLAQFASLYLHGAGPADPRASPLCGLVPCRTPPISIDVDDAEVLLHDSLRYAQRLRDADRNGWHARPSAAEADFRLA
jgi:hypothetical protein